MFCNLENSLSRLDYSTTSTNTDTTTTSSPSKSNSSSFQNTHSPQSDNINNNTRQRLFGRGSKTNVRASQAVASRLKPINLIVRRLRNLMEYCVNALNEASSTSCSNKFDLSTYDQPIWLLGRLYDLPQDSEELIETIRSKLWVTYRRNFPPIDAFTRYTTDKGFGCMIRCGQMVLANALLYKNLGRNWRWQSDGVESNPDIYSAILRLFQDREECHYSIHNIVKIGVQEGKSVGEWFGPNTIAQALKRLSKLPVKDERISSEPDDDQLSISIDTALDNVVVIDEVKSHFMPANSDAQITSPSIKSNDSDPSRSTVEGHEVKEEDNFQTESPSHEHRDETDERFRSEWIPGLLFIQLRLGLTKINPIYFDALKKTFQLKSSLGIIGGRPNHALYFIGTTEDNIIYLDPHITQQYINLDPTPATSPEDSSPADCHGPSSAPMSNLSQPSSQQGSFWPSSMLTGGVASGSNDDHLSRGQQTTQASTEPLDATYHCANPEKMSLDRLDPSLALCFYFHTEEEFDTWCSESNDLLIKSEKAPMFEITKVRPATWTEMEDETFDQTCEWNVIEM